MRWTPIPGQKVAAWLDEHAGVEAPAHPESRQVGGERGVAFVVRAAETESEVRRLELDGAGGLADVDLAREDRRRPTARARVRARHTRRVLRATGQRGLGRPQPPPAGRPLALLPSGRASLRGERPRAARGDPARPRRARTHCVSSARLCPAASGSSTTVAERRTPRASRPQSMPASCASPRPRTADLRLVGDDGAQVRFEAEDGLSIEPPGGVIGPAVPASCGAEPSPRGNSSLDSSSALLLQLVRVVGDPDDHLVELLRRPADGHERAEDDASPAARRASR